jgi:hypothetical protein
MLAEKKISVDEAHRLLSLIEPEKDTETRTPRDASGQKRNLKYFRVVVEPKAGAGAEAERVNVRVPIALIRAGIKLTSLIPAHASDQVNEALREKGIDFDVRNLKEEDFQELVEALSDLEVDVESGKEKVHVYVE